MLFLKNTLVWALFFSVSLFAEHSDNTSRPVLKTGPGFYPIDAKKAPAFVKDHTDSVYFLAVFAPTNKEHSIPARDYDRYDEYLKTQTGRFQLFKQLEKKYFFGKDSGDRVLVGGGTAFMVKDNNTIVSAAHTFMVHPAYKKAMEAESTKEALRILNESGLTMAIFDKDFKLVYSTRVRPGEKDADPIDFVFPGAPAFAQELGGKALEDLDETTARIMTDVIQLKLPIELKGKPLKLSQNAPKAGDTVYSLAFPWETSSRAKDKTPDSDGQSMRLMKGTAIQTPDFYDKILVEKVKLSRESADAYLSFRTFCDIDSVVTCSGGPIFNEEGLVIGMHNSRFNREDDRTNLDYPRATHGANARLLKVILDRE